MLAPTLFAGWQARHVADPVVVRDAATGRWRMYYSAAATDEVSPAAWDLWVTGLVTSPDGSRWSYPDAYEPVLTGRPFAEGEVVDERATSAFDALEARAGAVLRRGGLWWMWYTGWNGASRSLGPGLAEKARFRIGAATSPDGVRWTKRPGHADHGAVLAEGPDGAPDALGVASPSVLAGADGLTMWYAADDGGTSRIARATSTDGIAWTRSGVVLEPGGPGALDELGVRHPVVVRTRQGYELWYQGRSRTSPAFHVLRALSADGVRWTRVPGAVALEGDVAPAGDEEIRVGTVIARPDGRRDVFFSKETTETRRTPGGPMSRRSTAIYRQTVGPAR